MPEQRARRRRAALRRSTSNGVWPSSSMSFWVSFSGCLKCSSIRRLRIAAWRPAARLRPAASYMTIRLKYSVTPNSERAESLLETDRGRERARPRRRASSACRRSRRSAAGSSAGCGGTRRAPCSPGPGTRRSARARTLSWRTSCADGDRSVARVDAAAARAAQPASALAPRGRVDQRRQRSRRAGPGARSRRARSSDTAAPPRRRARASPTARG